MVLYLIGLGLGDEKDITVKGLEIVRKCDTVYLEAYTSILACGPTKESLETFYGRTVEMADREFVEQSCDAFLSHAKHHDVALLVVGDPFGATTHSDLLLRAHDCDVPVQVIHNASIMNACACCGLQLYNFGQTVSVCFWTDNWQPQSYFDKICDNRKLNLHTLCLLDIKVKEQTIENMMKGNKVFETPRYMSSAEACTQLLSIIEQRQSSDFDYNQSAHHVLASTECIGLARVGWPDQKIVFGTLKQLSQVDLGAPLHALIVCGGVLHDVERSLLQRFRIC